MDVDVKEHLGYYGALGHTILESSQPAMLMVAGVEGEAVVEHFHSELHHVMVQYCLQELEMESACIAGGSEVKEDDTNLTIMEGVLDILGEKGHLVRSRLPMAETGLLL